MVKCDGETMCVVCPHRYCVDEEEMYRRLIKDTKHQVEKFGLHWIPIWFEEGDTIALKAFERYRGWLKEYGYEGGEPSYKTWIEYTAVSHKPVKGCGCRDGTFYFHGIKE